jgi:hypothetical protein
MIALRRSIVSAPMKYAADLAAERRTERETSNLNPLAMPCHE